MDFDQQINKAVNLLSMINDRAVPAAAAMAANKTAAKVRTTGTRVTAKTVKLPQSVIRKRIDLVKATAATPAAFVRVSRYNISANSIPTVKKKLLKKQDGTRSAKSITVAGKRYKNVFAHKGKTSGKTVVYHRLGKRQYPIEHISVSVSTAMTGAFRRAAKDHLKATMPTEFNRALNYQLIKVIR